MKLKRDLCVGPVNIFPICFTLQQYYVGWIFFPRPRYLFILEV